MLQRLPHGWTYAALVDLAAPEPNAITDGPFGSHLKTSHYTSSGPRVIRLQNIGNGVFIDEKAFISEAHFKGLSKHHICAGDIAIAALGETLPRSCVIPPWVGPALVKADCSRFKPDPSLTIPEYLNYALNSPDVRNRTSRIIHGVGRPRLNLSDIRGIEVPLAPLGEQRRIVDLLDELLSELAAGMAALLRVRAKLRIYRASVMKAAVDGALTAEWRAQHPQAAPASELLERILAERRRRWEEDQLTAFSAKGQKPPPNWKAKYKEPAVPRIGDLPCLPEGWCWASLEQLSVVFVDSAHRTPRYGAGTTPALGPRDIVYGRIDLQSARLVDDKEFAIQTARHVPQKGDIIYSRELSYGWAAIIPDGVRVCLSQGMCLFRPHAAVSPSYLAMALNGPLGRRQASTAATGSTHPHINLGEIKGYHIPLPSAEEQLLIDDEVEDQLSIIDHMEADLDARLQHAAGMRQAILQHAFTGQLAPQDPKEEPAWELLERIAAERDARAREAAVQIRSSREGTLTAGRGRLKTNEERID